MANPPPADADQRRIFAAAYEAGEFGRAFGAYQLALIRRALALLGNEQYQVAWQRVPASTLEFVGGLAAALGELIDESGDDASYRLLVVYDVVAAVAKMQMRLSKTDGEETSPAILAELLLHAVRLGNVEVMLGQTEGGFLDEFANLKWREAQDFERRRKGASSTNSRRAEQRSTALRLAQDIVKVNPTLSNDDLAFKVKSKSDLPHAIRTITGWIRGWRGDGRLPPA